MENQEENEVDVASRKYLGGRLITYALLATAAFSFGFVHYKYVSNLFENDRNFSYLSDLEREMSFRTEMGFYYSYYKTLVEETPFIAGISKLMYDRLVEYPKDINAFNRFNIHPEVLIGAMYRYLEPFLNNSDHTECHMVERGGGHSPVESCIGLGQPVFFYLEAIWWLAGLTVSAIFLHASVLSHSVLGGFVAVLQYFTNHAECTRVQWAPNERENLAVPLLLIQAWLLTLQLRDKGRYNTFQLQVSIFVLNILCLLFWQFTQFIFLTQTVIFFVMEQLRIIDTKSLSIFLHSHFCGLQTAVLLLQGNDMLKSSLYASFFLVVSVYCLFFSNLRIKVQNRLDFFVEAWLVVLRILISICASLYLKKIISNALEVEEDSHIWEILYSKFTNYKSFHTLIYTCSEVFDFLPLSSVHKLTRSLLLPFALLGSLNVVIYWTSASITRCRKEIDDYFKENRAAIDNTNDDDDSGIENNADTRRPRERKDLDLILKDIKTRMEEKDLLMMLLKNFQIDAAIFYNVSQMAVYGVMAALVMRLKLLFTTQMCIVSSLMFNRTFFDIPVKKYLSLMWLVAMVPILNELYKNVTSEMSHMGEFSDYPQEQLLQWVSREASGGAFAGSMPILAAVMLSARRPIVAHPHYEHLEARQRAYSVYKVYGRFPPHDVYNELNKLRASYLIVETKYCYGKSSKGCSFENIWDIEAPELKSNPKLCHTLLTEQVEHFYPVFRNQHYAVFRIHDFSVRYMPRSFDT